MRVRTKRTCLLWQGQELQVLRLFFSRNLYNIHRLAGGHLEFPHHTANILQALPVSAFFNAPLNAPFNALLNAPLNALRNALRKSLLTAFLNKSLAQITHFRHRPFHAVYIRKFILVF